MTESTVSELKFVAAPGAGEVSAILVKPPHCGALFVLGHGAGAGMRHRFMDGIADALSEHGIASFRYQFPYVEAGKRRPDRAPILTGSVRAAVAAARELEPDLPLLAGGKSMGGRMTSTAQAESSLPSVRGLVFFGFPLHRPGDPSNARADHLADVDVPMLFVQGTRDRLAELDRVETVVATLGNRATVSVVRDGDHGFDVLKRTGRSTGEVYDDMAAAVRRWTDSILD
ncbi:MAG: alpha/beta hydrolase [Gemmatimonadetes bacterium]|nr:alpha/beta hydrolase [Gemmatimonadota bacterium]